MMRRIARLVVLVVVLLAGVLVGAAPAAAADDELRLKMPRSFTAGGDPEEVTLEVERREDGCVSVSMLLEVELGGSGDGAAQVAIRADGQWRPVRLSRTGAGRYVTEPVAPDDPRVCPEDPRASVLLLVGLDAAVTADEVKLVGHAYTEAGELMDATDESRDVRRGRGDRSPSASPSPSPSPSESSDPASQLRTESAPAPSTVPAVAAGAPDDGSAFGPVATAFGLGLVGLGVGLLIFVIRRNRQHHDDDPPGGHTMVLPRIGR